MREGSHSRLAERERLVLLAALMIGLAPGCGQTSLAAEAGEREAVGAGQVVQAEGAEEVGQAAGAGQAGQVGTLDAASLDPGVPSPESVLGHAAADRPVRYGALVGYLRALDEASPLVTLTPYAESHERRQLYYLTITSEQNHARLDEIKQDNAKLADPRRLKDAGEGDRILERLPAVAWLAYSIHGDELSSTDAAIQVAYELAAGTDQASRELRDNTVIHIDPLMNPDGRERYLSQLEHLVGKVPNPDYDSMGHRGLWSAGRGNHYLFDLNRDWLMQVHPETRGRAKAMLEWNPHLVVDSHEMGGLSTYLFSPPREPINIYMSAKVLDWRQRFAADQARAFDRNGWNYYTREWNEEWYVGYTNAWASLLGAASILYEQAGVDGTSVMQEAGRVLTYHEAVQHHVVSSMANLATLRANRGEMMRDYFDDRQWAVSDQGPHNEVFLLPPAALDTPHGTAVSGRESVRSAARVADRQRYDRFVDLMARHQIEAAIAEAPFEATDVVNIWAERQERATFPAGTLVIKSNQPHRRLLHAYLAFDPHMSLEALTEERKKIERRKGTDIYDVTAWSLPLAYGLEASWAASIGDVSLSRPNAGRPGESPRVERGKAYGYLIDAKDSGVYECLVRLFDRACKPRLAIEPFTIGSRRYEAGAVLLRGNENPEDLGRILREAAAGLALDVVPVDTGLSQKGPDLGGGRFKLLQPPRVAIASQWPVRTTSFGSVWFWLDARIGLRVSPINIQSLRSMDLRKYNVLVLPEVGEAASLAGVLGDEGLKQLKTWIQAGGTLIALGSAAEFIAGKDRGLSAVRLKQDVLDQLAVYEEALAREAAARTITIDADAVWGTHPDTSTAAEASDVPTAASLPAEGSPGESKTKLDALKRADDWQRLFSPQGAILVATLDPEHWLCFGLGDRLPVLVEGSACFMSMHPVATPARLMDVDHLRLSGLCWPEARQRLANSAYATVESVGYGQIVLLAGDPTFRGYHEGPARLFLNAVLLGPGAGASTPLPW